MYTIPTTKGINKNQFIDTEGFFTFRKSECFTYHCPSELKYIRFSKYRGYQVKMWLINEFHYGKVLEYKVTPKKATKAMKPLGIEEIETWYEEFTCRRRKILDRVLQGQIYFEKLHRYNPLYFSKEKQWIKKYKTTGSTSIGEYFVIKLENEGGFLKQYNGKKYLIVVSNNKSFKHGFMMFKLRE